MKNIKHGFTLVETLVAISIFSILVAIGVGGFVHALRAQREITSLIAVQSNASIALEQMTREIRTGYLFCNDPMNNGHPVAACQPIFTPEGAIQSGCSVNGSVWTCKNLLDFYNANGQNVDYELQNGALARSSSGLTGQFTPITGSNVAITYLTFTLFGNTEGDNWPPRITIAMGVTANSDDPALVSDVFNLQTTISARAIDCTQGPNVKC